MSKKILHVDMDSFFASVEQMDNPKLSGKPVIVGGVGDRGVVSTCSYEAREYGVHSAMPGFMAKKKCPMGIFLPVRYGRYKEVSDVIFNIFLEVTPIIEPLSIDEAFLDITNSDFRDGVEAAKYIKKRVKDELGLTLSVGISYNKFLAKIASDWNKPNGVMIITKEMMPDILFPLSISKVFGIGKKSVAKLNNIGIFTVEDLYQLSEELCSEYIGNKHGLEIYYRIRGIDNRELEVCRDRKSVGKEKTLQKDTRDKVILLEYLKVFSEQISVIMKNKDLHGKTVILKYKTKHFESHTRSKTVSTYMCEANDILHVAKELLYEESLHEDIRLIGLSVSSFRKDGAEQLMLF